MSLTDVISALPSLSQQELMTLKAAIEELTHKNTVEAEPWLYTAMARAIGTVPPYGVFRRTLAHAKFKTYNQEIETYLERYFPTASITQRHAFMTFIISALIADLKERSVPITVVIVTKNLGRFAQIVEGQFPGYLNSGLADMILRALKGYS